MNNKSLMVIADLLMAEDALLLSYYKAREIILHLEATIVDNELPAF